MFNCVGIPAPRHPARKGTTFIWQVIKGFILLLACLLSWRQLSDPDLGFHMWYGQWIVEHLQVPTHDLTTYTASQHPYIDIHWLFQVILYLLFRSVGYQGISVIVCLLTLTLLALLVYRSSSGKTSPLFQAVGILAGLVIIEPSFGPHPELISLILLSMTLAILDRYYHHHHDLLFLLPIIQLVWCNMHGLFPLGLAVAGAYQVSLWVREGHPEKRQLLWLLISTLICLVNPYFLKGALFPLELLTRFNTNNIFNQHIQEFIPFFRQPNFVIRDYLFLAMLILSPVLLLLTLRKRAPHEILLVFVFAALALLSIRNIHLFVVVVIPILVKAACERFPDPSRLINKAMVTILMVILLVLIPRIATDSWYLRNHEFSKTGLGLDRGRLPVNAVAFLKENHVEGRILNSLGFGGWLSWDLRQPVFFDGRLEVMGEPLYKEITGSWYNGLAPLSTKYDIGLIVYNYLGYYPWTLQLAGMNNWRLIYLDGNAAIFARQGIASHLREIDPSSIPSEPPPVSRGSFMEWMSGFWRPVDYSLVEEHHKESFRRLILTPGKHAKGRDALAFYNAANAKYRKGDFNGALSDYNAAIALKPTYLKALNNRAILYATSLKNYTLAMADFNKVISIDPENGEAWLGRGTAFYLLKQPDSACRCWLRAHSLGKDQAARLLQQHCKGK